MAAFVRVVYSDVQIRTFPIQSHSPKCTDAQMCDLESHAPFGGASESEKKFEIVFERAAITRAGGWVVGSSWWTSGMKILWYLISILCYSFMPSVCGHYATKIVQLCF